MFPHRSAATMMCAAPAALAQRPDRYRLGLFDDEVPDAASLFNPAATTEVEAHQGQTGQRASGVMHV